MKKEDLQILAIVIASISATITLLANLPKLTRWAISKYNEWLLNKNLRPRFSESEVYRATRYYIPTKFQNISPTSDEPGSSHFTTAKQRLIPELMNAFKDNRKNTNRYLILADSGMGKTTFLLNLFLNYRNGIIRILFVPNENRKMELFPLGSPDIWTNIEKIENKKDTILLLDAFDEDFKAIEDYEARMQEILRETEEFKKIIITCRTQFFPSDKEIPDDTGCITFGGEQEVSKFQRLYLSVFDDSDVKKYINKRFPFYQRSKRKKALRLSKNAGIWSCDRCC